MGECLRCHAPGTGRGVTHDPAAGAHLEIERVWLLAALPDVEALRANGATVQPVRIEQGYIAQTAVAAARAGLVGRVRRMEWDDGRVEHWHTIKRGLGRVREESESRIDAAAFARAWEETAGARLRKVRWVVQESGAPGSSCGLTWEIDQFLDFDLVLAEAECQSLAHAESLVVPSWLAPLVVREVTEEPAYRNSSLARNGVPRRAPGVELRPGLGPRIRLD